MTGASLRLGVIVDGGQLAEWQQRALDRLGPEVSLTFYDCVNMRPASRKLRHYPYYLLNLLSLRTELTRQRPLPPDAKVVTFECIHEGMWQRLPASLLNRFRTDEVHGILKFGMGLMRVPEDSDLPILSFHHGDPRHYRGRPAGFYELLGGERLVGQIVQRLSNRLDAGAVLAFGESRVQRHSYRATMRQAYRLSPLLLGAAVRRALAGEQLDIFPSGRVTRLPPPLVVLRFMIGRMAALARRLLYGALFEKEWQVATAPLPAEDEVALPSRSTWSVVPTPPRYRFLADPFFDPASGALLVEALQAGSGLGEILRLEPASPTRLLGGGHFSYPAAIGSGGEVLLLPEMEAQGSPHWFHLTATGAERGERLRLPGELRLLDPTPFFHEDQLYLFANRAEEGEAILRLWIADGPAADFAEHPLSPICLSPAGGRMGGMILERGGSLYRLGQDGRGDYGNGLLLFRIEQLTPSEYRERLVGELRCPAGLKGPHTFNVWGDVALFDFYRDVFAPLAGVRRVRARLARR